MTWKGRKKEKIREQAIGETIELLWRATDDETESSEGAAQKLDLGLKCIYVNARSIINKIDYLRAELKVFDPDIIGITESWTDDKG